MPEVKRGRDREMRYPSHGGPTVRISVPPAVSLCWSGHRECRMPGFEPIRDHRSPAEIRPRAGPLPMRRCKDSAPPRSAPISPISARKHSPALPSRNRHGESLAKAASRGRAVSRQTAGDRRCEPRSRRETSSFPRRSTPWEASRSPSSSAAAAALLLYAPTPPWSRSRDGAALALSAGRGPGALHSPRRRAKLRRRCDAIANGSAGRHRRPPVRHVELTRPGPVIACDGS